MGKVKTVWCCNDCGHRQPKWSGQCQQCESWNSFSEDVEVATKSFEVSKNHRKSSPIRIKDVDISDSPRMFTKISEFDRLVGGGIVNGSLTLVGGNPGIGKSTLLLQIAHALAVEGKKVLYVCGEESLAQTSLRAQRLDVVNDNVFLLNETNMTVIRSHIEHLLPHVVIMDSIQVLYKPELPSAPGTVSQVRDTAAECMHMAKGLDIAFFVIGHVTKSGEIAGPRILEHLVDTVLYFEGDKYNNYRMLRVIKNRFGATDEIAVFRMEERGLIEVSHPSQLFLEERNASSAGTVVTPTVEGSRPILVEVQSLVTDTAFSSPSRRCTGIDQNRLALLLAVLEKRVGYNMYRCDVFVSVTGGIKIVEPALDLGILLSIASSCTNKMINPHAVVMGEVGLSGEVRSVPKIESRIKEAKHMGFTTCIVPWRNVQDLPAELTKGIKVQGVRFVEEAIHALIQ
jgi:DNA repair protein RadA/Sms